MKIERNPFRDYTAESALFVRRALVAFLVILVLSGTLIANLYNLQIVRVEDYRTRSNENRIKLVPSPPAAALSMIVTAPRWRSTALSISWS
ncbi:penicillin-binding protein 2 [Serratia plymuthica]|nr:penicillin-binding protein 2 [Serratia plymuthica]